ncbi:MAG: phosphate ABC transporter permease subunit PstC, partial [Pseudomonadota bacterium]
ALHSRPSYHGLYSAAWVLLAGLGALLAATVISRGLVEAALLSIIEEAAPDKRAIEHQLILSDAYSLARGGVASATDPLRERVAQAAATWGTIRLVGVVALTAAAAGFAFWRTQGQLSAEWRARNRAERVIMGVLWTSAVIAILTTIGIVLSLMGETLVFFQRIDWQILDYLFGTTWSPLSGVFEGKMDAEKVGAMPLFAGTLLITLIAMLVAAPVGLFSAIYLSDFAGPRVRAWAKPMLELLAGIPTVVYGFFAAITVAPFIRSTGESLGLDVASESALAAGLVMGIMIIPFVSSLSDDVINAVPQSLREGSYGLGATKAETMRLVVLPAALPGIVSAILLGISRAVGETMIVVMAAGQGANLTANPLEAVTTVTVQIVALITGDTEADTAAAPAFTLGFTLFVVTLALNMVALRIVRRYRELYD